ncbi:MAG: tetratricopeptide repeat protein, partial [Ignavibacteriaceae bacterium]
EDHRLWSRYGYFTLWLGKKKIALEAFEKALSFRPYFKEAMDGYDLARDKGYTYTYFDTTYRKWEKQAKQRPPEYIIDKYYRILKSKNEDDVTRFALVEELIKVNRFEEASQQLQILKNNQPDNPKFIELSDTVAVRKENYIKLKIEEYILKVNNNPNDQEAVLQLAQYYSNILDYDNAAVILENYLKNTTDKEVSPVRFKLAQVSAWNYQWENAIAQLNILMANDSTNIDYQLLRGRIAAWMVQDLGEGKVWLGNVLKKEPQNMHAIISLVTIYTWDRDFPKAQEYINLAEQIDSSSKELETVKNLYNSHLAADEERKIFSIRGEAGKLSEEGNFQGALEKYDEYLSKITAPNKQELIEYADIHKSLHNFPKAIEIYNKLLDEEYDPQVALLRGTAYLWNGDSTLALTEFQKLAKENPDDFQANLYLGESYEAVHEYDSARTIYDSLLVRSTDSSEIKLVQQRIGWMPVSGFISFFNNLSTFVRVSPQAMYFADNQNLKFTNVGGSIELGLFPFLSTDVTLFRGNLKSNLIARNFATFKWHLNYNYLYKFYASAGTGNLTYQGLNNRTIYEASLRLIKKDVYSIYASYENTDAVLVLYSPKLLSIAPRISSDLYRINGNYQFKSKVTISGSYRYISLSDRNKGNDLQFRLGKPFTQEIVGGYEYGYAQYAWNSKDYYSPQNYESHSIWADLEVLKEDDYTFSLSGKIGYVPSIDFIIREISAAASYKPTESFLISGTTSLSHSYRFDMNYRFVSAFLSIYWSF